LLLHFVITFVFCTSGGSSLAVINQWYDLGYDRTNNHLCTFSSQFHDAYTFCILRVDFIVGFKAWVYGAMESIDAAANPDETTMRVLVSELSTNQYATRTRSSGFRKILHSTINNRNIVLSVSTLQISTNASNAQSSYPFYTLLAFLKLVSSIYSLLQNVIKRVVSICLWISCNYTLLTFI